MKPEITYRIATKDDYKDILKLYNKMYGSNRSLVDFEWLVDANPAGQARLFIALLGAEVVGMQSLIPYRFLKDGKLIHTFKSEDSLVDKKMRGQGIYSELYRMVHKYAKDLLIWGLTDKNAILENVNMPSSERLTIAVAVNRPSLKYDGSGLQKFVAKTMFYTYLYLKSSLGNKEGKHEFKIKEINQSEWGGNGLQSFFKELSTANPSIYYPFMNEDYLHWRLSLNPNLDEFKIYGSFDEGGNIVLCSIIGFRGKSAYWESLYKGKGIDQNTVIGHISKLKKNLFSLGVNLIHTWLFQCNPEVNTIKDNFIEAGFSKVREGLWIVHNSTDKDMDVHDLYFSPQLGIR